MKLTIKCFQESSFYNIEFCSCRFYYSAGEDVNYFDFGGTDCKEDGYKHLIIRMNKYFIQKKFEYGE